MPPSGLHFGPAIFLNLVADDVPNPFVLCFAEIEHPGFLADELFSGIPVKSTSLSFTH